MWLSNEVNYYQGQGQVVFGGDWVRLSQGWARLMVQLLRDASPLEWCLGSLLLALDAPDKAGTRKLSPEDKTRVCVRACLTKDRQRERAIRAPQGLPEDSLFESLPVGVTRPAACDRASSPSAMGVAGLSLQKEAQGRVTAQQGSRAHG